MPSRDRRLQPIRRRPRQVRFSEIQSLLTAYGFEDRSGKGDHRVFGHPLLSYNLSIDPRRPFILPVYVRNALRAIDDVRDKMAGSEDDDGS